MFQQNTLDSAVIQTWSERTRLYRRRTRWLWIVALLAAYSGEVDRLFRRNVTGDSAESAL
jgi:hypothetical protein